MKVQMKWDHSDVLVIQNVEVKELVQHLCIAKDQVVVMNKKQLGKQLQIQQKHNL